LTDEKLCLKLHCIQVDFSHGTALLMHDIDIAVLCVSQNSLTYHQWFFLHHSNHCSAPSTKHLGKIQTRRGGGVECRLGI